MWRKVDNETNLLDILEYRSLEPPFLTVKEYRNLHVLAVCKALRIAISCDLPADKLSEINKLLHTL